MRFASRTDFGNTMSPYGDALRNARRQDGFLDLTLSNPTRAGFDYSAIDLSQLSTEASLHYNADPLGTETARVALASLYPGLDASHIVLTASTSVAYGYLLRLFCEPGDQVLVPSPSYPLLDLLAQLHDVELITYPLVYHDGWQVDPASLQKAITPRTRAIVAIHPNNPTGHFCSDADCDALYAAARLHSIPLIVDEVFLDFAIEGTGTTFLRKDSPMLTVVLGGLSKTLGLPQMKLGWMAVCGPEEAVRECIERLEVIADTFLSVGTPVQSAVPAWLRVRPVIQQQILTRIHENLSVLDAAIAGTSISRLKLEGGWSAVLRVPSFEDDEELAIRLLRDEGIAVHPGSFYGFPQRGWLVVSLLLEPRHFVVGVSRLLATF